MEYEPRDAIRLMFVDSCIIKPPSSQWAKRIKRTVYYIQAISLYGL